MTPSSRSEFKAYVLRRLGHPILKINVTDEQIEDRIDEALKYYADYHFDGTEKKYFKYQVTDEDKANGWVPIPESIIGLSGVFPIADAFVSGNFFNIRYQYMLNNITDITSHNITPYYIARQYMELLEEIFVGKSSVRYNRHSNKCYVDINWGRIETGQYLIFEVYEVLDPETYSNIWGDRWLASYVTAKVKLQWGDILSKYQGMKMPGMVEWNAERIIEEAQNEINKLEENMMRDFGGSAGFLVG